MTPDNPSAADSAEPFRVGRWMAGGNGSGIWRAVCVGSLTLNATLIASWFGFGTNMVTHDALDKAIKTAPYPWIADRSIVMDHVLNPGVHENDGQKRARIQQELKAALAPLETRLDFIDRELDKVSRKIDGAP